MTKMTNLAEIAKEMRNGALIVVMKEFVQNGQSFSKYDVTSATRALLNEIMNFKHEDVKEFITETLRSNIEDQRLPYQRSIVDGPTGEYVLFSPTESPEDCTCDDCTCDDCTCEDNDDKNEDANGSLIASVQDMITTIFDSSWMDMIKDMLDGTPIKNIVKTNTYEYTVHFNDGSSAVFVTDYTYEYKSGYYQVGTSPCNNKYSSLKEMCDAIKAVFKSKVSTVPVNVPDTQSVPSTRVYVSKKYSDIAGFTPGTKLKISTKNKRSIVITQCHDDDFNYVVNADGRIRISSYYLDEIGLDVSNMIISAYPKLIMISNIK